MKDDGKYYLLLDEVQFMSQFEEVLNSLLRMSNIDAVSYTHLDVYKRQLLVMSVFKNMKAAYKFASQKRMDKPSRMRYIIYRQENILYLR